MISKKDYWDNPYTAPTAARQLLEFKAEPVKLNTEMWLTEFVRCYDKGLANSLECAARWFWYYGNAFWAMCRLVGDDEKALTTPAIRYLLTEARDQSCRSDKQGEARRLLTKGDQLIQAKRSASRASSCSHGSLGCVTVHESDFEDCTIPFNHTTASAVTMTMSITKEASPDMYKTQTQRTIDGYVSQVTFAGADNYTANEPLIIWQSDPVLEGEKDEKGRVIKTAEAIVLEEARAKVDEVVAAQFNTTAKTSKK